MRAKVTAGGFRYPYGWIIREGEVVPAGMRSGACRTPSPSRRQSRRRLQPFVRAQVLGACPNSLRRR
ncbi:hypothetical protein ADL02_16635 [Streptomyces sp. NRRL WC-3723]|nr:hypothetical protein ADL02_16635 [Streptomyces sp. NRRL WC-3723]